ncbi:hypothetical protein HPB50_024290 [Hyalomma asiaticum]|uniref:Uncharacterized protein n=1 Tax=Hyalomma asiaticum TaxID=266040 RepID=A0ACB7RWF5_HYAAI|nr:hypothetical protein HPB50_024290 [Hyalomma asiaticum]
MDGLLRDRLTMLAALGTGVVVGISGIYLYYRLNRTVSRELNSLACSIADLRREIEQLRTEERGETPVRSESLPLQHSLREDEEDDEYYDFTDVEDASWTGLREAGDSAWLDSLDAVLDRPGDKQALLDSMLARESQYSRSCAYFWRLAKALHLRSLQTKPGRAKEEIARQAFARAQEALRLDESCPEAHKWYAITLGALSEYVSTQEKIENGYRFKRKLAGALYSQPPDSTLQEARAHFLAADKLRPDWKENLLHIGKTYICEGHYGPAMAWIDRAAALPCVDPGDDAVHKEVENLQQQYQRYRP